MTFERKKEVKESLGIGIKANAILINNFYVLEAEIDDFNFLHSRIVKKSPLIITDPRQVFDILEQVSLGNVIPSEFCFEADSGNYPSTGPLINLEEMRGKYVKYRGGGFPAVSAYDKSDEFTNREVFFLIPKE